MRSSLQLWACSGAGQPACLLCTCIDLHAFSPSHRAAKLLHACTNAVPWCCALVPRLTRCPQRLKPPCAVCVMRLRRCGVLPAVASKSWSVKHANTNSLVRACAAHQQSNWPSMCQSVSRVVHAPAAAHTHTWCTQKIGNGDGASKPTMRISLHFSSMQAHSPIMACWRTVAPPTSSKHRASHHTCKSSYSTGQRTRMSNPLIASLSQRACTRSQPHQLYHACSDAPMPRPCMAQCSTHPRQGQGAAYRRGE